MTTARLVRYPSQYPGAPHSGAVRAGDFLFLAGQTPKDEKMQPLHGEIEVLTRNVLDTISATLKGLGSDLSQVRATVWLSDLKLMSRYNAVFAEYFKDALPVRSTVEAKLNHNVDIEIEVTVFSPQG
jgi:enamine deaminase RidA (YjgF/YER057c/UK114 family)